MILQTFSIRFLALQRAGYGAFDKAEAKQCLINSYPVSLHSPPPSNFEKVLSAANLAQFVITCVAFCYQWVDIGRVRH